MTGSAIDQITVVSHVGRDLLQSAAVFKHERLVVWEYVSNGLQYIDPGTKPTVRVSIDQAKSKITIVDNGRGMGWLDLKNFFVMHGENVDRKKGQPGRGFFGTGKAAAFGIAGVLRVTTVKNGKRSAVQLTRADIDKMSSMDPIPVTTIERETATSEANGTTIEIDQIKLRRIDQSDVIRYIERHIAHWPNAIVYVNTHLCEYVEPPTSTIHEFVPQGELKEVLGEVILRVKVARAPLAEDEYGIAIFSNGVWHETTLAGSDRKELANYIFGEIDVPKLASDQAPIPPFDLSRSMELNRSNELVQHIFAFIGFHVEEVRKQLVAADKARRSSEEARRLAKEASEIAKIINRDFASYRTRIMKARAEGVGTTDARSDIESGGDEVAFIFGSDEPAVEVNEAGSPGGGGEGGEGGGGLSSDNPTVEPAIAPAELKGRNVPKTTTKKRNQGGFSVEFQNMGATEKRAKYDRDSRTIFVNIDHPQLKAALGVGGTDDIAFRRLAYEVAFVEYAVAVASEMVAASYFLDLYEPVYEIRETMNRVALAAASLYSPGA